MAVNIIISLHDIFEIMGNVCKIQKLTLQVNSIIEKKLQ